MNLAHWSLISSTRS
uniref:Uncharacterized protein n=1 Tax=Anguilla anguilla TaxID=7936 RepID=A0A0E9XJT2_ANGAN